MSEIVISIQDVDLNFPKRRGLKDLIFGIFKKTKSTTKH